MPPIKGVHVRRLVLAVNDAGPLKSGGEPRDDGVAHGVGARGEGAAVAPEDVGCCGPVEGLGADEEGVGGLAGDVRG